AIDGVGRGQPQGLGEAERRLWEALAGLVLLGELEPEVGVVGRRLQLAHQQRLVARALALQVLGRVAVVADLEAQAALRQFADRLLVDAPDVADAARQHARDPGLAG